MGDKEANVDAKMSLRRLYRALQGVDEEARGGAAPVATATSNAAGSFYLLVFLWWPPACALLFPLL